MFFWLDIVQGWRFISCWKVCFRMITQFFGYNRKNIFSLIFFLQVFLNCLAQDACALRRKFCCSNYKYIISSFVHFDRENIIRICKRINYLSTMEDSIHKNFSLKNQRSVRRLGGPFRSLARLAHSYIGTATHGGFYSFPLIFQLLYGKKFIKKMQRVPLKRSYLRIFFPLFYYKNGILQGNTFFNFLLGLKKINFSLSKKELEKLRLDYVPIPGFEPHKGALAYLIKQMNQRYSLSERSVKILFSSTLDKYFQKLPLGNSRREENNEICDGEEGVSVSFIDDICNVMKNTDPLACRGFHPGTVNFFIRCLPSFVACFFTEERLSCSPAEFFYFLYMAKPSFFKECFNCKDKRRVIQEKFVSKKKQYDYKKDELIKIAHMIDKYISIMALAQQETTAKEVYVQWLYEIKTYSRKKNIFHPHYLEWLFEKRSVDDYKVLKCIIRNIYKKKYSFEEEINKILSFLEEAEQKDYIEEACEKAKEEIKSLHILINKDNHIFTDICSNLFKHWGLCPEGLPKIWFFIQKGLLICRE